MVMIAAITLLTLPFALIALGALEVRVGRRQGVRSVRGTLVAELDDLGSAEADEVGLLTLDQRFMVDRLTLFGGDRGLARAVDCLQRIELKLTQLQLLDDRVVPRGAPWPEAGVQVWLNGQALDVSPGWGGHLPQVVVQGPLLSALKVALLRDAAAPIHLRVRFPLHQTSWPHGHVVCTFSAQPTFVLRNRAALRSL